MESIKSSEFLFDYVQLLYYKCHKINPNCSRSYIDSPDWIKSKKATINPINKKDNKCLQSVVTVALIYEENMFCTLKKKKYILQQVIFLMISNG